MTERYAHLSPSNLHQAVKMLGAPKAQPAQQPPSEQQPPEQPSAETQLVNA